MAVRREHGRWRYRVTVTLPDVEKMRIGGTPNIDTKDAARIAERDHILRVLNPPAPTHERKEVPTFGEFAEEYMEGYVKASNKPSEQATKRGILAKHLSPRFGDMRLDEIGVREVDALRAAVMEGRNPRTVNHITGLLVRVLRYAAEAGVIDRAPRIRPIKVMPSPFDFLAFEEFDRLCQAAEDEPMVLAAIVAAGHAGLRRGELIALRWEDIDLKATTPQLTVRWSSWKGHLTSPKGGRARKVPLSDRLTRALKRCRHLNPTVFCREDGSPWTWEAMRWSLPRACKRAGLRVIGWHALRHTFCSHLAMRGATPKAIQELAGHADLTTTMRYMHLSPGALVTSISLLDLPAGRGRGEGVAKEGEAGKWGREE